MQLFGERQIEEIRSIFEMGSALLHERILFFMQLFCSALSGNGHCAAAAERQKKKAVRFGLLFSVKGGGIIMLKQKIVVVGFSIKK